jgi:DNA invertase Pin-like site-specific DNA recombinase
MNAWSFYRRSTNLQELSIDDQRRDVEAFAQTRGWKIVKEFVPAKGYASGMTIDRDPTFIEMIRLAERGGHGVRFLLVYDVSRFGRLPAKLKIYYEQHFQRHGIRVVYVKDDFRNDGSIGDDITQLVKHSEAHQYSVKLSELTLRGMKSHAKLGHSVGGKAPYGYDRLLVDQSGNPVKILRGGEHKADKLQRVIFTPSPSEAPIVREIFEAFAASIGVCRIADDMNSRKVQPPRGQHWMTSTLRALLKNRVYLGERIYNRRSYKGYRRGEKGDLFNPSADWIHAGGAHEPLIDENLWARVQARFKTWTSRAGGRERKPYLLSGMCICARCGYKLLAQRKRSGKGYERLYYQCGGYARSGRSVCFSLYIPAEYLEAIVINAVRDHLKDPAWRDELGDILAGMVKDQFGTGAEERVEELKSELGRIGKEIENMIAAIRAGTFSPSLAAALKDAETRREDLKLQLRSRQEAIGASTSPQRILAEIMTMADDFEENLAAMRTIEQRKDLVRSHVAQVNIVREGAKMAADCLLWKVPQMMAAQDPPLGTLGRQTASFNSIAGAGFAIRRKALSGQKDTLVEKLPLIPVRRYPLLTLAASASFR